MVLQFSGALDPKTAGDQMSSRYQRQDLDDQAELSTTARITIDERSLEDHGRHASRPTATPSCSRSPASCRRGAWRSSTDIRGQGGETVEGVIDNTIHKLGDAEPNMER